jgi:hypothetical protein
MLRSKAILLAAFIGAVSFTAANAECEIGDAKLEEAIQKKPRLRGPANSQSVRDLRTLRDAAFMLRSYGRHEDCERLLGNIRELIAGPSMNSLGDNDEEEADKQNTAREPKTKPGGALGARDKKDAKPLLKIDELARGLRADGMMGAEVRSSTTRS